MRKLWLFAASLLICFTPSLIRACTCAMEAGSCNQAWKFGQVIFTGKVTNKVTANSFTTFAEGVTRNAFQFAVSESFRGSAVAGEEITVYTGTGGGDCGYDFKVGTSYLVYASVYEGKLVTGICTPTSLAAQRQDVIRQLRALQKGERIADLFGMISTSPVAFADDPFDLKPLARKVVRVIGTRNLEQSTTTDEDGVYSFQNLPADTYRIEIDPPDGMSTWQRNNGKTYTVEVGAQGRVGCPASLSFSVDGRIRGIVVDEAGNGVAGFITLEPVDEKDAALQRQRGGVMGFTTDSGEFELSLLRPNRYRLLFRPKIREQIDFRTPPVKSEIITLGLGEHIDDFRLKVPK